MSSRKSRVAYFYKHDIGSYYYGPGHPMKPHRLRLTHHLLLTYGMYRKMEVLRPHKATQEELERFHAHDYVEFLKRMSPDTEQEFEKQMGKFNIGPYSDCPVFEGLYEFMSSCGGASIDAAVKVNHGLSDICINWSGGLHHAKKGEASGFCYINDIVLCILELLKYHARVLYIDIDIHHGDGVEEAFYTTDRVMTASFHKYGDFFPGSGAFADQGVKDGKYYAVNFPLKDGLDDESFELIFKPVLTKIMEVYRPGAVVMCCGADSITGDRLGVWNLSLRGHGMAVEFMKSFGIPVILLGGGGYTPRTVARCWSYETAIALGIQNELEEDIPFNQYHNYFGPNYKLHLTADPNMKNQNQKPYLEKYTNLILENMNRLQGAPSVQFQEVPPDFYSSDRQQIAEDEGDPEMRQDGEERPEHAAEFFEGEKDQDQETKEEVGKFKTIKDGVKQEEGKEESIDIEEKEELKLEGETNEDLEQREEVRKVLADVKEELAGANSAFETVLPRKRPYPSGTECGGFIPEEENEKSSKMVEESEQGTESKENDDA